MPFKEPTEPLPVTTYLDPPATEPEHPKVSQSSAGRPREYDYSVDQMLSALFRDASVFVGVSFSRPITAILCNDMAEHRIIPDDSNLQPIPGKSTLYRALKNEGVQGGVSGLLARVGVSEIGGLGNRNSQIDISGDVDPLVLDILVKKIGVDALQAAIDRRRATEDKNNLD